MKFTLSLHDYLDQLTVNREQQSSHCPVCYEQVMTRDLSTDVKHLFQCYKEELLIQRIVAHKREHGVIPVVDHEYMQAIDQHVTDQLISYCESYQKLLSHPED